MIAIQLYHVNYRNIIKTQIKSILFPIKSAIPPMMSRWIPSTFLALNCFSLFTRRKFLYTHLTFDGCHLLTFHAYLITKEIIFWAITKWQVILRITQKRVLISILLINNKRQNSYLKQLYCKVASRLNQRLNHFYLFHYTIYLIVHL